VIHTTFSDVWELERFLTANVTFKVIQGHSDLTKIEELYRPKT